MSETKTDDYGLLAPLYDRFFGGGLEPLRGIAAALHPVEPGTRALDIGAGTGSQLVRWQAAGVLGLGVEPSAAMAGQAAQKLGVDAPLCRASGAALPFADSSFDLVAATLVLHELEPALRAAILDEARRVLHPGGTLLIAEHHPGPLRGLAGRWRWLLMQTVERIAGRRHYRNFRQFQATGGAPTMLAAAGFEITERKVLASGTLALFVARPPGG